MNLRDFWEKQHQVRSKDEPLLPTDFAQEVQEIIEKSPKRIFDIGCASGRDSLYFADKGHIVRGIDISNTAVAIAEENARKHELSGKAEFISADILTVGLPQTIFDVVYGRMSLQYFTNQEMSIIIGKLLKVLTTDGLLFAQFRSVLDEKYGIGEPIGDDIFIDNSGHTRRFFDKKTVKMLFSKFKIKHLSFAEDTYETMEGQKKARLLSLIGGMR